MAEIKGHRRKEENLKEGRKGGRKLKKDMSNEL